MAKEVKASQLKRGNVIISGERTYTVTEAYKLNGRVVIRGSSGYSKSAQPDEIIIIK